MREHEKINGFASKKLKVQFDRLNLSYFIPKQALIKVPDRESAYSPDVLYHVPSSDRDFCRGP